VFFRQFVDADLGCASYLIGDQEAAEAVLVDPTFDVAPYLAEADRAGVRIARVLETHTHADHLSGHGRLALEHGVPVAIHEAAQVAYEHEPLVDGAEIPVGTLRVRVLHTPGHRPEHCCFLAGDNLLTGDSLFVGTAARPDLAVKASEGAEGLFHSLHRLTELRDGIRVFPGHVAGSLCGAGMSSDTSSTIGQERRLNPTLAVPTVEEFVHEFAWFSTPRPPNMHRIVELNRGPFVGEPPPLELITEAGNVTVLDVRSPEEFAAGHLPGALNVPVAGAHFGTKAGFVLQPGEQVAVYASSAEQAGLAARRLYAIGFLEISGRLESGAGSGATETMRPLEVAELDTLFAAGEIEVLDVRELDERDGGYVAGTRHLPYRLARSMAPELPHDRPVATICESGARAAIAASVLAAAGIDARPVLHGGLPDWEARGREMVEFRRCGA
jgi:glyoxylase-like metal-dependent hydrolase (beta-lactamase superfamily II)/rhodanese-related sulfurtransferase